jgi:hypothetical protein
LYPKIHLVPQILEKRVGVQDGFWGTRSQLQCLFSKACNVFEDSNFLSIFKKLGYKMDLMTFNAILT